MRIAFTPNCFKSLRSLSVSSLVKTRPLSPNSCLFTPLKTTRSPLIFNKPSSTPNLRAPTFKGTNSTISPLSSWISSSRPYKLGCSALHNNGSSIVPSNLPGDTSVRGMRVPPSWEASVGDECGSECSGDAGVHSGSTRVAATLTPSAHPPSTSTSTSTRTVASLRSSTKSTETLVLVM